MHIFSSYQKCLDHQKSYLLHSAPYRVIHSELWIHLLFHGIVGGTFVSYIANDITIIMTTHLLAP